MSYRSCLSVVSGVWLLVVAPGSAQAVTQYAFSATIADTGTSFGLADIQYTGLLTDPTLLGGEGLASLVETSELLIDGVPQTGVEAVVLMLSSPPNRFELFVRFDGVNNPDITIVVDLPGGIEADFPEIDFDLAGVQFVVAEINEDGILPKDMTLHSLTGTVLPEPAAVSSGALAAFTLAALARRRQERGRVGLVDILGGAKFEETTPARL